MSCRSQLTCELCCPGRCLDWYLASISVEAKTPGSRSRLLILRDPGSPKLRSWFHGTYLVEEVILHPNHHLTFGDWILRELNVFSSVKANEFGRVFFINKFRGSFVYWSWENVEEELVFPTHIGSSRW